MVTAISSRSNINVFQRPVLQKKQHMPRPTAQPSAPAALQKNVRVIERDDLQDVRTELAKKLNDIDRVDKIVQDYATILEPKIPKSEDRKQFKEWMKGAAYFLGSPYYDHNLFFNHLKDNAFFSTDKSFKSAFNHFTRKIQGYARPIHKTANKVKNIAIMYPGTGGGGHKAPAAAMAKSLEAKGYKVKLIDSDEFEKPYDPKVEGLSRGEIYSKVYQQQGNIAKAQEMWGKSNELQPLKDRKYMRDITDELRKFRADHLFVVAHHQPENTSLAYQLGLPTTYVHTDNEFHHSLLNVALNQQEIKKPLVSFTSLSDKNDFYHHLNYREGKDHYNNLSDPIKKQMVPLDFPIRENFNPVTQSEKTSIRNNLNIDPNATVVKIAMGANGIPSDIKMIMDKIKQESHLSGKPLHVLVVCGANKDLKAELDAQNHNTQNAKFQILGFLNEKEMSDFDKASDVWITKPGGSTSAEALAMRKQMLYVTNPHHLWELTNARRLEKENLAEEYRHDGSLMEQINRRASIGETVEYAAKSGKQWTEQLAKIVNRVAEPIFAVA